MLNLFKFVGLRHIQLKPLRNILTLLGVAFGISLYVAIDIINHSTRNSMRESIEAVSGKAKFSVSAGLTGFDENVLEIVRVVPGVKAAVPMIEARAFFEGAAESSDGLYILGIDLLQEQSVRTYKTTDQKVIDDPLIFLNQPDSIILTKALAQKRGLKIDSKIKLATAEGVKTFTVRGLLEPEGAAKAHGGQLAIMDIDGVRVTFGREGKTDRIDIVPEPGYTDTQIKENIQKAVGPNFKVETPEDQGNQMEQMVGTYQMILIFFSATALLVGLFLIFNSVSISVAERRKEIGTLRALGATRTGMVTLFVVEMLFIGLLGSALGCLMGRGLAELMVTKVTQGMAAQFQTQVTVTHLEFTNGMIAFAMAIGTLTSLLAALLPAYKASQVHPLESMKVHSESLAANTKGHTIRFLILGLSLLAFMTFSAVYEWNKIWFGFDAISRAAAVFATAFIGPIIVIAMLKLMMWFLKPSFKKSRSTMFRISSENLLKNPKRTTANVMALLVGLFLVMVIATVRTSFHTTLTQWLDQIFHADLLISSSGRMINSDVQLMKEQVYEDLLKVPGVLNPGAGRGAGTRILRLDFKSKTVTIKAMDHFSDVYEYKNFKITSGDRVTTAQKIYSDFNTSTGTFPTILVSDSFIRTFHYKVGDTVELDTPTGRVPFAIVGSMSDYASPAGVIYMSRNTYKKYWKDPLVTAYGLNLAPGANLEEVRAAIMRNVAPNWNVVVFSNSEFKAQMVDAIDRGFAYTRAVELIALVVALLGLLNTLLISVMERTREIGMLRAVGATKKQIRSLIIFEAVLQGFWGSFTAIIFGALIGYIFITYSLSSNLGWIINFHLAMNSVWITIGTGIVVAVIAGLYPSYKAANLVITEALDYE